MAKKSLTAEQRAEVAAMIEGALDRSWRDLKEGLEKKGKELAKEFGNADASTD